MRQGLARWRAALLALVVALFGTGAHAEATQPNNDDRRTLTLAFDSLSMSSRGAPYVTTAFPEVSGYGVRLRLDAELALGPVLKLGLRVPLVLARIEQPAGGLFGEAAWANPELSAGVAQPWLARDGWQLLGATRLAIGLPLAEYDASGSELSGRALALADAGEGFAESELYTPGVLPIVLSERVMLKSSRFRFGAALKLPLLVRISEAGLPRQTETHALGLEPVAELSARVELLRWFALESAPRLTWRLLLPVGSTTSKLQLLLPVALHFRLAQPLELDAVVQAPVAGALGGTTFAGGLRVTASF